MAADPFAWPEDPRIAALRAQLAEARNDLAAAVDRLDRVSCEARKAKQRDGHTDRMAGLVPACRLLHITEGATDD